MKVRRDLFTYGPEVLLAHVHEYIKNNDKLITKTVERHGRSGFSLMMRTINLSDEHLKDFIHRMQAVGIQCDITETIRYDRHEILSAPACFIRSIRRPIGHIPIDAWENLFDVDTGCKRCWAGANQVASLVLSEFHPRASECICETLDGHWLVREPLREKLKLVVDSGCLSVVRSPREAIVGWAQLIATSTLPRLSPNTVGIELEDQCPVCHRDGYYGSRYPDFHPHYEMLNIKEHDVAATYERFGKSGRLVPGKFTQRVAPAKLCVGRGIVNELIDCNNKEILLIPVNTN